MSKSFLSVLCAMFLFLGVIIGFMWAPVKGGVYCGNHNSVVDNHVAKQKEASAQKGKAEQKEEND